MSRRQKPGPAAREQQETGEPRRACCMVSELLEESGIDRERIRRVRRQVLQGVILLCQWQLERMDEAREESPAAGTRKGRNISVE